MKKSKWQIYFGFSLIILSVVLYIVHFFVFRNIYHIGIFLLGDIAFVPVEVLLVTLIIHRLLTEREKRSMLSKMNMAIGTFFSEVGTNLLKIFSLATENISEISNDLIVNKDWSEKEFKKVKDHLKKCDLKINSANCNLEQLREVFIKERMFLLDLLQNPNLLEQESFTDMLWAVFHLAEELTNREDIVNLSKADLEHILIDVKRAYERLIYQWVEYMKHLKKNYPYLFSFAMRTNPFDKNAKVEFR